ncbi:hypothetical protein GTG23_04720, partial [Rhodococcus hoagii]|nr:hypothetical protein [Prescottella equi]
MIDGQREIGGVAVDQARLQVRRNIDRRRFPTVDDTHLDTAAGDGLEG